MNRCVFSIVLMLFFPCISTAMEGKSGKRPPLGEAPFGEFKYSGPRTVVCPLDPTANGISTLVTRDKLAYLNEQMALMVKQITNPATASLFADVLDIYKEQVMLQCFRDPSTAAASKQRSLEAAIRSLKADQEDVSDIRDEYHRDMDNANRLDDLIKRYIARFEEQQAKTRTLMATQVTLSLVKLNASEQFLGVLKKDLKDIEEDMHDAADVTLESD